MTYEKLNALGVKYAVAHGYTDRDGMQFLNAAREGMFAAVPGWEWCQKNDLPLPQVEVGETVMDVYNYWRRIRKELERPPHIS